MANNNDKRGFGSMDENKQRDAASRGGQGAPAEKRSFSQDHDLASEAGRKGGQRCSGSGCPAIQAGQPPMLPGVS